MNKRGASLTDLILLVVIAFAFVIITIIGAKSFSSINDELQASDDISATAKGIIDDANTTYVSAFDGIFLFMFIGLGVALFIGAFMLDSHPVFYFFALFLLALTSLIAMILGNVYVDFAATDEYSDTVAEFTIIPFVMSNFLNIIIALGFLLIIGLYAKNRQEATF